MGLTHSRCLQVGLLVIEQCAWLILSRKLSSSPAGRKLRVWRQTSRAGGGVFTEVNWLKLRYILHIMLWCSPCSQNLVAVIHEMTEFYNVFISVILLPLLQRLYTPLSAVLNISETCVHLRVTQH